MWKKIGTLKEGDVCELSLDGCAYLKVENGEVHLLSRTNSVITDFSKPKFKHDCDRCKFLFGESDGDVYFCEQSGMPTLIKRYGDKGPEYYSGFGSFPEWEYAESLAIALGYLPKKKQCREH